jgi:transcription initiation factor TFIIB
VRVRARPGHPPGRVDRHEDFDINATTIENRAADRTDGRATDARPVDGGRAASSVGEDAGSGRLASSASEDAGSGRAASSAGGARERERDRTGKSGREATVCPECGGRLVHDAERGETACESCGLVVDDVAIDRGPEWRAFDAAERDERARTGAPTTTLLHDGGLSTQIDWRNRDGYGNALSADQRARMSRLRTWDERFRTKDHGERNLKQALGEVDRMGSALGLPESVRETAAAIYRRALAAGLLPGRSIEGVATAAVYAATRQASLPRTIDDVAAVSRVDADEFVRAYRYLNRELGLPVPPPDPRDYLARYASALAADDAVAVEARRLLDAGIETGVTVGKSPAGLAAAALYAAGLLVGADLPQTAVAEAAGVSTVTIRDRYTELLDAAGAAGTAGTMDGRVAAPS